MKVWRIAARPSGRDLRVSDFSWHPDEPAEPIRPGTIRVRPLYFSMDPAQKGWMDNAGGYTDPTQVGDVMPATGIAMVVESQADGFAPGDHVQGMLGWRDEAVLDPARVERVPADDAVVRQWLGVLGTTGLTAYFGLKAIGRPFPGETMVVTGAAGGVGSIVGQIGRIGGCRVIGIAGGPDKCRWLVDELGFDAAIDYREGDVAARVRSHAPDGIDVLWDGVGGDLFDDLLGEIAMHARVVVCGGIARYEQPGKPAGPHNYFNIIYKRARMEGFILGDFFDQFPDARQVMSGWIRSGQLRHREDIAEGLENAPEVLMRLFRGDNIGKLILSVA